MSTETTESKRAHTPEPWGLFNRNGVVAIVAPDGKEVVHWTGFDAATAKEQPIANASFIVRAVNSHADLLTALEGVTKAAELLYQNSEGCAVNHYQEDYARHGMPGWLNGMAEEITKARAAIKRAKGE